MKMKVFVKRDFEWLYPDEAALGTAEYDGAPIEVLLAGCSAGGFQVLLDGVGGGKIQISADCGRLPYEINLLRDVAVEFNTAGADAGFDGRPFVAEYDRLPPYCTRRAPFRVYDAFVPFDGQPTGDRAAFYVCFAAGDEAVSEQRRLQFKTDAGTVELTVKVTVGAVSVPGDSTLSVTNWFSAGQIAQRHGAEPWSEEFFRQLSEYADAMRSVRQTHFLLPSLPKAEQRDGEVYFDFGNVERAARLFFDKGFTTLEFAALSRRGQVSDERLISVFDNKTDACDPMNLKLTAEFLRQWSKVVHKNGWDGRVIYHIADEPDEPLSLIESRHRQYAALAGVVRECIPGAKIIDAVKTDKFADLIDIMVPLSRTVQENSEQFDAIMAQGREVWFYVCCCPTGEWYNRFLDADPIGSRLLFWAAAARGLTGYLHWGFNQLEQGQDPFESTNQRHTYGGGVCLPAGDSHMVYPEKGRLWRSMRMEMQRHGAEEYELLMQLKSRDPQRFERLTDGFSDFCGRTDKGKFISAFRELLTK